ETMMRYVLSMASRRAGVPDLSELSVEQMVTLPVEILARSVVMDLTATGDDSLSIHNWVRPIRRRYRKNSEAIRVISEVVAWLRHEMILVDDLSISADGDWVMLSRRGTQWMAE
ncbi:hypothetical protein ACIPJS_39605, partial [Streptomyces sp. NPDC086783]|uniref:hypothetical protein n=1 Tax=Streptomyces sp. NPDC086783 TaxID=3365758 RepID=UPI0038023348